MKFSTWIFATLILSISSVLIAPASAESPKDILDRVHALEQRHDPQSLVDYAKLLIDGIPIGDSNPLRVRDYTGARAALEASVIIPGSHLANAQVSLAKMLLKGQGGTADRNRAIDLLERSAAAGSGEASFLLGQQYANIASRLDDTKSYYRIALGLGYAKAGLELARLLQTDDPKAARDVEFLAMSILQRQAKEGRASAAMAIGDYYIASTADPLAGSRSLEWYERAVSLGDDSALLAIARIEGDPSSPLFNASDAGKMYRRAAEAGSLDAALAILTDHDKANQFGFSDAEVDQLAELVIETANVPAVLAYANLRSVSQERRREIADSLFERLSSDSVDIEGMLSLGAELRDGDLIPVDAGRALAMFRKASTLGSDDGVLRLAEMLMREPALQARQDVGTTFQLVKAVAEKGNSDAEVLMGDFSVRGFGTRIDPSSAIDWYSRAAEHNSAEGMTSLAQLYLADGDHSVRQKALPWLVRAADLGSVESQLELADAYVRGDIVDRDVFKAIEAYHLAVAGKATGALDALATVYLRIGGPGAVRLAQSVYEAAVAQGYPEAEVKYGAFLVQTGQAPLAVKYLDRPDYESRPDVALLLQGIYFKGLSGKVDKLNGRRWMDRAISDVGASAIQQNLLASALVDSGEPDYVERGIKLLVELDRAGDAEATRRLANVFLNGVGGEVDVDRAMDLFDRAIDAGNVEAEVDLGDAYLNGTGVRVQIDRAVSLFEDAVTKAPDNAAANLRLGNIHSQGLIGQPDQARAAQFYEAAANSGSTSAQRAIGLQYLWGNGVPQDARQAEFWLQSAADNGSSNAYSDLAILKSAAMGTEIDAQSAFSFNYEAAKRAYVPAMIEVGIALVQGFGVPADALAGTSWLKRAAELGSNVAMYDLYEIYSNGYGTSQDTAEASRWLTEAADAGNGSALFRKALTLLAMNTDASKQDAVNLLRKAASVNHNQSKKLLVKMGLLSPSEADDSSNVETAGEGTSSNE